MDVIKKIGLIVNPISGMGGSVGLKGTDGIDIYQKAVQLGAVPKAEKRTKAAMEILKELNQKFRVITCSGEMGEYIVQEFGFNYSLVSSQAIINSRSEDTIAAASKMKDMGVDILLFAGGDGTARDIYTAVENTILVLGIPTGVKIQSGVFASSPVNAGVLTKDFLEGRIKSSVEAEVMDIDENLYRQEILTSKLYGYLNIPAEKKLIQNKKSGSIPGDKYFQEAIAHDLVEKLQDDWHYLVGPGTTTRTFLEQLSIQGSLLGVDLIYHGKLERRDLNEKQILAIIQDVKVKLIITPTGGQGFLFGRGNQQLSSQVLKVIGKENILIAATPEKIQSLTGRPFLVDTGDTKVDDYLAGYYSIITGYHQYTVYHVSK